MVCQSTVCTKLWPLAEDDQGQTEFLQAIPLLLASYLSGEEGFWSVFSAALATILAALHTTVSVAKSIYSANSSHSTTSSNCKR